MKGHASDPPDISFYTHKVDCNGDIIKNKYGFEELHCNRGTPDVENIHKQLISTFGTWITGVEMSDCLLDTHRHQFNHNCSERKGRIFLILDIMILGSLMLYKLW